jgi:hypothetical protein
MADDNDRKAGAGKSEAIPEVVRKMLAVGLSGFFTTEEALRRALGDTIPQDWVDFASAQSERTRQEFSEAVAKELGNVLERVDLAELLGQLFENRSVEITAKVRLLPEDGAAPRARVRDVRVAFESSDDDDADSRDNKGR